MTGAPRSLPVGDAMRLALRHHRAGDLARAREIYRAVLDRVPAHADALGLLAAADAQSGRLDAAEAAARRALELDGANPQHHLTLGNVLKAAGRLDDAVAAYERGVAAAPAVPEMHYALGLACREARTLERSLAAFERAAQLRPGFHDARLQRAEVLREAGRWEEAVSAYEDALAAAPGAVPALVNLGALLGMLGRYDEAIEAGRRALAAAPENAAAHVNLGKARAGQGFCNEAIAHFERALALEPGDADLFNALGGARYNAGLSAAAVEAYARGVAAAPASIPVRSNALLALNYDATDPAALRSAHREFGAAARRDAGPPAVSVRPGTGARPRRIRVGYVSPDFRAHSVAFFLEPIVERHDRDGFEVFCYAANARRDRVTDRFERAADAWVDASALADAALAERIRADAIDVLVDVAGHTGGARLGVFVRRAAPVQVTFLGYPTATGIDVMDYRVTDARVDPPGADDAGPEAPLRLPHSYFCYRPPADAPPVGPLPAPGAGHVTFGSFNNLAKASAATLDLWAAVLRAVPASRLVLKNRSLVDSVTRMRIAERLDARGVDPARLAMSGWEAATHSHLAWYHRVDVALDSFPYNGATTTCEAMWMGVPVVSLTGATHAARMGCSILAAAGAADLAVESPAAFVDRCVALVADLPALAARRAALRATLAASPLLDEEPYVRELERLYRSALERRAA